MLAVSHVRVFSLSLSCVPLFVIVSRVLHVADGQSIPGRQGSTQQCVQGIRPLACKFLYKVYCLHPSMIIIVIHYVARGLCKTVLTSKTTVLLLFGGVQNMVHALLVGNSPSSCELNKTSGAPSGEHCWLTVQLYAVDHSARVSMKSAANCVN